MAPWLKRAGAMLHELAFVVTRDNALLDVLQAVALATNCVQVYAYIFDDELPWGYHDFQERIGYSLLHLHGMTVELQGAYWIIIALIIAMLGFAGVTLREMTRCVGERARRCARVRCVGERDVSRVRCGARRRGRAVCGARTARRRRRPAPAPAPGCPT